MAHTHKLEVVGQRILAIINANTGPLSIDDTWYGDQEKLPGARTVCVEPVTVRRNVAGAPDMVENRFAVAILVYVVRQVDGSIQEIRTECNQLADAIEDLLHLHLGLEDAALTPGSDIVIHGFVEENLSGYTFKMDRLIRSSRLTWTGLSKTSLRFGP